jgi:hypothetical protein
MDACDALNSIMANLNALDPASQITQTMFDSWAEGEARNFAATCPRASSISNCINQSASGCLALIKELKIECGC